VFYLGLIFTFLRPIIKMVLSQDSICQLFLCKLNPDIKVGVKYTDLN